MIRWAVSERTLSQRSSVVRTLCGILSLAWGWLFSTAAAQDPPAAIQEQVAPAAPSALNWDAPLPVEILGVQVYPARIHTWLTAYAEWLGNICQLDVDQRHRLEQAIIEHSASPQVDETARSIWTKSGRLHFSMSQMFHVPAKNMYPAWFADERTPSVAIQVRNGLEEWLRKDVLTFQQSQQLTNTIAGRTRRRRAAFRDALLQQLHPDLSLTESQWRALRQKWDMDTSYFDSSLFELGSNPNATESSLRVRPRLPEQLVALGRNALSQDQQLYLEALAADPKPTDYTLAFSPWPNAESEARLEVIARDYGSHLQRFAELRIQEWIADAGLGANAASALRTAAAEASRTAAQAAANARIFKIRVSNTPEADQRSHVNLKPVVFGPSTLSGHGLWPLDQEPVWTDAVKRAFRQHPYHSPAETARARAILTEAVLTSLDQELWLTEDQRTRLRPLIDAALPTDVWDHELWTGLHHEIIWCAYPLLKIRVGQRQELLTPPQQRAWSAMAAMFIRLRDVMKIRERSLNAPEGFSNEPAFANSWVIRDDEKGVSDMFMSSFKLKD